MEEITVPVQDKSNQDIHVRQIGKHNDKSEVLPGASGGIAFGMDVRCHVLPVQQLYVLVAMASGIILALRNADCRILNEFLFWIQLSSIRNCPSDSHPSGGFPVSKFAFEDITPLTRSMP
jgi:hypothetical protein